MSAEHPPTLLCAGEEDVLTETVEKAIHLWPLWSETIEATRGELGYDLTFLPEQRDAWISSNGPKLTEMCMRSLTLMRLPKNFSRYWIACVISERRQTQLGAYEYIRWPVSWMYPGLRLRLPKDPVPAGCWRIEAEPQRYYRGDHRVESSADADSIRIFPPSLVTVTIPKWAVVTEDASLTVVMLPRDEWRDKWGSKTELPVIMDFPDGCTPTLFITPSEPSADSNQDNWRPTIAVDMPPWAVSNDLVSLAHEQLSAIREWHEQNEIHPMAALTKSAAARLGSRRIDPPMWARWLTQYSQGDIDYRQLVERVYYDLSGGQIPRWPSEQPQLAKKSSDWVRRRLKNMGMTTGTLTRNWWREISYRGES